MARFLPRCGGPTSAARSTWAWRPACCRGARRSRGARCVPRRVAHRAGSSGGLDAAGILRGGRRRPHRLPRAARRRPAGRLPRPRPRPTRALAGARTVIAVDTFLTASSAQADVVLPAAALRREGAAPPPTSRAASAALSQKVTAAGNGPRRLDDRRRAGADRSGRDLGVGTVERGARRSSSPPCPPSRRPRRPCRRGPRRCRARPIAPATLADVTTPTVDPALLATTPSRGQPDALRRGRRPSPPRRRSPRWPRGALHVHPLDLDRLGATTGTALKVSSPSASLVLAVDGRSGRRPRHGLAALQPAVLDRRRAARLDRRPSSTSASRTWHDDVGPGLRLRDPLLTGRDQRGHRRIVLLKVVVSFVFLLIATMLMVWFERKVIAGMQNRIGPNKAGPFGILQTLADGIKLFFKEPIHPERADPFVFRLAPYLAFVPGVPRLHRHPGRRRLLQRQRRRRVHLRLRHLPAGRRPAGRHPLRPRPVSSIAVYGIMLAGWSSRLEVPAARLGAGLRADGQLRGRARPVGGHRAARGGHAVHQRHRRRAGHRAELEPHRHRRRALRGLRHRRRPPSSTARRSTWSRPSRSSSAASTPSTPRSASPSSTWPSS